jgi:hypothetical protein
MTEIYEQLGLKIEIYYEDLFEPYNIFTPVGLYKELYIKSNNNLLFWHFTHVDEVF